MNEKIERFFYKSCLRKANLSKRTADSIVDKHLSEGKLMYYYKCSLCNSYHLTSKPPINVEKHHTLEVK